MNRTQKRMLKTRAQMVISLFALAVSLTSLAYVTYSWFIFNRTANVNLQVSIEKELEYEFKYFDQNGLNGYHPNDLTAIENYSTNFLPVSQDFHELVMPITEPGLRRTYALELTLESTTQTREYEVILESFTSTVAPYYYDLVTEENIDLKEAINIYAQSYQTNNIALTNRDSANTFLATPGSNQFDRDSESSLLSTITYSSSENPQMVIFFFTIEFSGDPSTFYNFHSRIGNNEYYEKATYGNSNVYKNLAFTIDALLIRRIM